MEEQTLYDELVNGLREIEKNVITDLNAGQASGSWMGRIVSNEAPANYLNVQITEIQRTGMISVQADTVVKNKIVGIQKIEIGKEDVMKNGVTSFENKDFLDHLKSNSRSLETVSESITDKGDQRFMVFQTGQKENSLREHYKWLKSNGYNEFPEEDGKASAPAAAPTKKINREIKFNVPKGLTKAEFENTIKFLKENGAKYHVDEKIWTIKESQREKFALAMSWMKYGKPSLSLTLNGVLAGLVGITAGCDAVAPSGAVLIGAICGVVMIFAVDFIDKVLKIDDPVGASSVHGVCGFLGTVLTGLFSTSEGLFYGHGAGFLGAQLFGAVVVGVWAAGMGFIIFKVLDKIHGLRVPARVEEEGLDIYEHGESAYN